MRFDYQRASPDVYCGSAMKINGCLSIWCLLVVPFPHLKEVPTLCHYFFQRPVDDEGGREVVGR